MLSVIRLTSHTHLPKAKNRVTVRVSVSSWSSPGLVRALLTEGASESFTKWIAGTRDVIIKPEL